MKLGDIKGESAVVGHADEIEVLSWSWGLSLPIATGGSGGVAAAAPKFTELSLTKRIDRSSPLLALNCAQGKNFAKMELQVYRSNQGADQSGPYLKITLEDLIISSYSTEGATDPHSSLETITLRFNKIEYSYTPISLTGSALPPVAMSWNIATNSQN